MINELYNKIQEAKNKKNIKILLQSDIFKLLNSNIKYDNLLEKEILSYINGEKEDIEYNFKKKIIKK